MDTHTLSDTSGLSTEDLELLAYLLEDDGIELTARQAIFPRSQHDDLPLSFAQSRLWFLNQLDPDNQAYNDTFAIRVTGRLDIAALERSLNEIVRRHEVLRTSFPAVNGQPVQVIAPALRLELSLLDLRHMLPSEREQETVRQATLEVQQSFDLAHGPLVRARLLRLAIDEYIILLTFHHIVFDGWSTGVFLYEVMALYDAFIDGRPSPLPELPIQYADFAIWQRQWLHGEVLAQQLAYWRRQLRGGRDGRTGPPVLEPPTDHPRPPRQTHRGAHYLRPLPLALAESLTDLSQREGATLFMTLLAAFNVLLYRYSGQDDIVVGTPIANRDFVELEQLIGFFVNTQVLRTDLTGVPRFRELLARVRETTLEAYVHQNIPFEQLAEELQMERNLSHNPLFQVMFLLQNAPVPSYERPDLRMSVLDFESGAAMFDLMLVITETPTALNAVLEYSTDLFERATMERLLDQYHVLLAGIAADPDQLITRLPLLTEAARRQLLVDWNATAAAYPHEQCAHQLIEAQAARTPDAVAVVFDFRDKETRRSGDKELTRVQDGAMPTPDPRSLNPGPWYLTYAELNARANALAHHLRVQGVGPETLVGLCIARSVELLVGMLGILKAGAAYLPLDPAYPAERLAFMLADSQARVLLVTALTPAAAAAPPLPRTGDKRSAEGGLAGGEGQRRIVNVSADWPLIARSPTTNLVSGVMPDNLAYVIYTSGSLGQPKGVAITHGALVNHTTAAADRFAMRSADRVLQFASISFDTAAEEIYPTLTCGATLVLRTDAFLSTATHFLAACRALSLTVLDLPTAYWHQLTTDIAAQRLELPAALRLVIIGGEAALPEGLARWRAGAGTRVRLLNTYGPTEATIAATGWELPDDGDATMLHSVPIGRPIANAQVYVLDAQLQPVPIGIPGELHIGGAGLARGYLNRPDVTAERFIPNPFVEVSGIGYQVLEVETTRRGVSTPDTRYPTPGTRLYRTGDRARFLPDGNLDFLGRVDQQVKIRGFRVELGEIEAVLQRHPAIHAIAVVARTAPSDELRLVAYVVPTEDERRETKDEGANSSVVNDRPSLGVEMRRWALERLPDYMIPNALVVLAALPLTPSGKVDRSELPSPDWSQRALDEIYVAPRTAVETTVADLAAQVLGIAQVGIHDNFFALGGHSLLATQLIARLREIFAVDLPLRSLFEAPTVVRLAERIETLQWMAESEEGRGELGEEYEEGAI